VVSLHTHRPNQQNLPLFIVFREKDLSIAEKISRSFCEREISERQEGFAYGAQETRDSVFSFNRQEK
jgi:hypothetical protein